MSIKSIKLFDNQKVDYLVVLDGIASTSDIDKVKVSTFNPDWSSFNSTYIFAPFTDDLASSFIDGLSTPFTGWVVYRRKVNDSKWDKVAEVDRENLSVIDHLIENRNTYVYRVDPLTEGEVGVSLESDEISTNWYKWSVTSYTQVSENVYVADECWMFDSGYENPITMSDVKQNISVTQFETNSRYNKESRGDTNYLSFNISCLLGQVNRANFQYEDNATKLKSWRSFVAKGNRCIIKDIKGCIYAGTISEPSSIDQYGINKLPTTISFTFTERENWEDISVYSEVL